MIYIITILILIIDQGSKLLSVIFLKESEPIMMINNFLQLNYAENFGAAFSILQNQKYVFIIITIIVIMAILIYIRLNSKLTQTMKISLALIISGALGNLIDRIRLGYVIDFIDIKFGNLYDYPIFNIADSAIVIGTLIVAYLILFDKYQK